MSNAAPKPPARAADLVAIRNIEHDTVVMKSGGLRALLLVSGMNFELRSDEDQTAAIMAYQSLLNGLDFSIQIFMRSRKVNIGGYVKELEAIEMHEENNLLKSLMEGYRTFIETLVAENPIMEKRIFVVVPYDPYGTDLQNAAQGIIGRLFGATPPTTATHDAEAALSKLGERIASVTEGLMQIGLRAVRLRDQELEELFANLYDPQTIERHIMSS